MARVSTYLNFARNTEEAFNFYKTVFGGEFSGEISRFKDVPPADGMPPLDLNDRDLIMHVQLDILGGTHSLMGTDAPETMGFSINQGNNVHIMLETDSREETKKYFDALSGGGNVTMDLADMFWGAYYGSCTDKYGVQWMFNYQNAPV